MNQDKKILYLGSFAFFAVLLSAFFLPGEYSGRITAAFLLVPVAICFSLFVKKRSIPSMNKREVTFIVGVAAAMYLAIYFLSGILFGFHSSSGSRFWARISVSTEVFWKGIPYFRQPSAIKPISKSALWAAKGRSPTKARKALRASS